MGVDFDWLDVRNDRQVIRELMKRDLLNKQKAALEIMRILDPSYRSYMRIRPYMLNFEGP